MTHCVIFLYDRRSVAVASQNIVLNQVKFYVVLALLFFFPFNISSKNCMARYKKYPSLYSRPDLSNCVCSIIW